MTPRLNSEVCDLFTELRQFFYQFEIDASDLTMTLPDFATARAAINEHWRAVALGIPHNGCGVEDVSRFIVLSQQFAALAGRRADGR